jgi:GYF domain 2
MEYYVKHGEGEKGPYALEGLRESLAEGALHGSTLVRAEGSEAWKPLDAVVKPKPRAAAPALAVERDPEVARSAQRAAAERNMLVGGLICVVGIGVTAVTYSGASSSGGHYVVAWGAIAFGALRFFRGLSSR